MSGRGDERAEAILIRAVQEGPRDVLGLLRALRRDMAGPIALHEGAIHVLLHRFVRAGTLATGGASPQGLILYRAPEQPAPPAAPPASTETPPAEPGIAKRALSVARAVRDPSDRGRVLADVRAHLEELEAAERPRRFGRTKAVRTLLQRVDRGKPTVALTDGGGDAARRFLLHEGPWLLGAVIVFFVLKLFVVSPFQIPSESMLPTLERGDRVAVFTLFQSGVPDRWRVTVYERGGVNYVKRLVGLPGEELALWHGDVYVDGALLVKPDWLNDALRSRVGRWTLDEGRVAGFGHEKRDGARAWWWRSGRFQAHPGGELAFGVHDGYATLEARRDGSDELELRIAHGPAGTREASHGWTLRVGPDGIALRERQGLGLLASHGGKDGELLAERAGAPPTGPLRLALSYVDGVLRARCGDWSHEAVRPSPAGDLSVGALHFGAVPVPMVLTLDRDQHWGYGGYTHGTPVHGERRAHKVPEGHVFLLGDNTVNSMDSRESSVSDIPVDAIVGPVSVRIWPPSRLGRVK